MGKPGTKLELTSHRDSAGTTTFNLKICGFDEKGSYHSAAFEGLDFLLIESLGDAIQKMVRDIRMEEPPPP